MLCYYMYKYINRSPDVIVLLTTHFEEISRKMEETK